jgi:hypothetical protein
MCGVCCGPPAENSTASIGRMAGAGRNVTSTDRSKSAVKSMPQFSQWTRLATSASEVAIAAVPRQSGQRSSQRSSSIPTCVARRQSSSVSRRSVPHVSASTYGRSLAMVKSSPPAITAARRAASSGSSPWSTRRPPASSIFVWAREVSCARGAGSGVRSSWAALSYRRKTSAKRRLSTCPIPIGIANQPSRFRGFASIS